MKQGTLYSAVAMSLLLALSGCGSDDSTTTTTSVTTTGFYVDSAINGVEYSCGDKNGTTDSAGKFIYEDGKDCSFSIAGIELKKVAADMLRENVTIVEDNVTVAAFLQTLDSDGNASNGITITKDVAEALQSQNIIQIPQGDANLSTLVTNVLANVSTYHGQAVTEANATLHLKETQELVTKEMIAGKTFYVVFDDSPGIFVMKVDQNATNVNVGAADSNYTVDDPISYDGNAIIWPSGNITVLEGYKDNYILSKTPYSDGTSTHSYMFESYAEADAFANELLSSIVEPQGLMLVAPSDPTELDLASYKTLLFYKNASFNKYNYYAQDGYKYAALLTTSVGCLDYGYTDANKISESTRAGVETTTYYSYEKRQVCIENDFSNADDENVTGSFDFVVYYDKQ